MISNISYNHAETTSARTNAELFRPRENTGNPQYDFYTHYSRLSGLQRLALERHTVNGTQISRYEPDISHSTTSVNQPGFVASVQDCARELLGSAALVLMLGASTPSLANAECVRSALDGFDLDAIGTAQSLLTTEPSAPEFTALVNRLAAQLNLRPAPAEAKTVDHSQEVKIAAPEYAARRLGNVEDAAEFIRCLHLIAGRDASALYLQQLASYYYAEAKRRPVNEVLKEMGLLGMEMAAVTATVEQMEFADDEANEFADRVVAHRGNASAEAGDDAYISLPLSTRRALFMERAARVLGEIEDGRERIFADELRAQTKLIYRKQAGGFANDEFADHLGEVSAATENDDEFGAYLDSFERAYEQYDEGSVVSLHMTDGERKIACGDLDCDTAAESLPKCARHLADELYDLYTSGFPLIDRGETSGCKGTVVMTYVREFETRQRISVPAVFYGIDTWMDAAIDEAFGGRVARTLRRYIWVPEPKRPACLVTREEVTPRVVDVETPKHSVTTRAKQLRHFISRTTASVPRSRLHEQTEAVEVCPNPEERAEARAVLDVLLNKLKIDYHTRGLNQSAVYRDLSIRLAEATDTAVIARIKKEAWNQKEAGRLSVKLFSALNTHASVRQATLEAGPMRESREFRVVRGEGFTMTKTYSDGAHQFIVAQPLLSIIPTLTGKTLGEFAAALHPLPRQEQERVRRHFAKGNPRLYARVRDGLRAELERASMKKLCYFRWAFYAGNKPEHPVHTLTRTDLAAAWELLKSRSQPGAAPAASSVVAVDASSAVAATSRSNQARRQTAQKPTVVRVTTVRAA